MNKINILALGSNMPSTAGSSQEVVSCAIDALLERGFCNLKVSRFYKTPPFPADSGSDYVNAVALFETKDSPQDVLAKLHDIEADMGRVRDVRWGSRIIDIDLISMGNLVLPNRSVFDQWQSLSLDQQRELWPDQLILPHPRMQDRAFVLVPLAEVAPGWRHPVLGKTVEDLLEEIAPEQKAEVVAL